MTAKYVKSLFFKGVIIYMDVEQNNRERSEIWALFWLSRKREKKENIMWAQDCVKSDNIWYIYNFVSFEGKNIGEWIYGLIWISNGVSLTKKGCVCLSVIAPFWITRNKHLNVPCQCGDSDLNI